MQNVDIITLAIDIITEPGCIDGFFDGSNYRKLLILLLVESLVYIDADLVSPVVSTERTKGGNLEGLMLGYWFLSLDGI